MRTVPTFVACGVLLLAILSGCGPAPKPEPVDPIRVLYGQILELDDASFIKLQHLLENEQKRRRIKELLHQRLEESRKAKSGDIKEAQALINALKQSTESDRETRALEENLLNRKK